MSLIRNMKTFGMKFSKLIFVFYVVLFNVQLTAGKNPIKIEDIKFLNEADDYIDEIPDGLQDKLSDALYHITVSQSEELNNFRKIISREIPDKENLSVRPINIDIEGGNIDLKIYRKKGSENDLLPVMIFFHSGGFFLGDTNSGKEFCEEIAASGKFEVIAANYPLSPEVSVSQILKNCMTTINYILDNSKELRIDKSNINICGEGAGATLALRILIDKIQKCPDVYDIKHLILFYPLIKKEITKFGSWRNYGRGYGFDSRVMTAFIENLSTQHDSDITDGSLIEAASLENITLPPIMIIEAGRDIILDQTRELANTLESKGLQVKEIEFSGAVHSFVSQKGQPSAFNKAVELTLEFMEN